MDGMAARMASALAVMHWKVGIDADDVEFVLGPSPSEPKLQPISPTNDEIKFDNLPSTWKEAGVPYSKKRGTRMWLLDFNRCKDMKKDMNGVRQAVRAFYRNDPYFPRPLSDSEMENRVWGVFSASYLATGGELLADEMDSAIKALPKVFLDECIEEQQRRIMRKVEAEKRLAEIGNLSN